MSNSIVELLDEMYDEESEKTSLGEIVDRFEDRGFGPLLLVPALIALLPTGAIPGVPTLCGLTLFFICIQAACGKKSPWLPKALEQKEVSSNKLESAIDTAKPYAKKFEKLLKPRLTFLSDTPVKNIIAGYCALAALCMIPLEALPFAVALPALALCITALGMTNRDGVFLIIGSLLQLGTAYLVLKALGAV
ncbi:exopolysaccharide biosynthesis protein [Alteromonas sp. BL110]|uniref:exopolysaccharide biosynthesis protein n=1 Tax=Alteromonas sp. BL110 TaxID=1714845 RepID=UPI000E4DD9E0|nr:exopolysaccharide biosynthesis protein [Alteromonas sp. BL110]AXT40561.1 exopolysaccharide biosynthesis protein [Alteromonas sp. BL110]RKM79797.1 exopolysaccharide biosynthesis protein [Alteromonas sp. BL110]